MKTIIKFILVLAFVGILLGVYYNLPNEQIKKLENNLSPYTFYIDPYTNPSGVIFPPSKNIVYILPDNKIYETINQDG